MGNALIKIAPSDDFRTTIDTTRYTIGVYVAPAGADTVPLVNYNGDTINHPIGGEYLDVRIKAAPAGTELKVYYYEDRETDV